MNYRREFHFEPGRSGRHPTYDIWAHLYERLAWRYGPDRALKKVKGEDHESRLDELAWRCLGEGRARA